MEVALVMFKADGSRREFPLSKSRLMVGRTSRCDLRVPLSSVSRQHCELRIENDKVRVRDLGSSNGTFHNHTRIQEAELAAGDELMIGPVRFTVVIDGKPEKIEPVPTIIRQQASVSASSSAGDSRSELPSLAPRRESDTLDFDDPLAALEALASEETDIPRDDEEKP